MKTNLEQSTGNALPHLPQFEQHLLAVGVAPTAIAPAAPAPLTCSPANSDCPELLKWVTWTGKIGANLQIAASVAGIVFKAKSGLATRIYNLIAAFYNIVRSVNIQFFTAVIDSNNGKPYNPIISSPPLPALPPPATNDSTTIKNSLLALVLAIKPPLMAIDANLKKANSVYTASIAGLLAGADQLSSDVSATFP